MLVCDVFPDVGDVAADFLRVCGERLRSFRINLVVTFRKALPHRCRDFRQFKISARPVYDGVPKVPEFFRKLVVVHVLHELLRGERRVVVERLPPLFVRIMSRVEYDAVRVQMRIERARRVVLEKCGDYIAGRAVPIIGADVDLRCCESLQFLHCDAYGTCVSGDDSLIAAYERSHGHRLRRRHGEVVKHTSVRDFAFAVASCSFLSHCETLASLRIPVFAERDKMILLDHARETEARCPEAEPLAAHAFAFRVIVAHAQVFREVGLRVCEIGLCLWRKHRLALSRVSDVRVRRHGSSADADSCENPTIMKGTFHSLCFDKAAVSFANKTGNNLLRR